MTMILNHFYDMLTIKFTKLIFFFLIQALRFFNQLFLKDEILANKKKHIF